MQYNWIGVVILLAAPAAGSAQQGRPADADAKGLPYCIVDTGQRHLFSDRAQLRTTLRPGQPFYGQDACYQTYPPAYRDNGDGTVSDLNTALMWVKALDGQKTFEQAVSGAESCRVGGHDDWRLPTIKELYSLIDFNGSVSRKTPQPYLDTRFFAFEWGNVDGGRIIDSQFWSSTQYVGTTMGGMATVFGVNFADGRIKGYPRDRGRQGGAAQHYVRYVRDNPEYGINRFKDNADGTISDLATGLMWSKSDNGRAVTWKDALAWAEGLTLAGRSDWRLPNAKELQSIVDYTRAPAANNPARRGAAIDPLFRITKVESYFWSSTTHLDGPHAAGRGVYVAFGRAMGYMINHRTGRKEWMDVHGAGAQRSDPKSGDPKDFPTGMGPQGDDLRIYNFARAVCNIDPKSVTSGPIATDALPESTHPNMQNPNSTGPPPRGRDRRPPPPHRRPR